MQAITCIVQASRPHGAWRVDASIATDVRSVTTIPIAVIPSG